MANYSKIEIKTMGEAPSVFVQVLVDGRPIHGVRAISYKNDIEDRVPVIQLDLNALDVSVDSVMTRLNAKHGGEIAEIKFKDGYIANFE